MGNERPIRPAVVVQLKGGLGNQLFQYATAAALARASGAQVALDEITGFAHDRRFRRRFELGPLRLAARSATGRERAIAALDRALKPLRLGARRTCRRSFLADFVAETEQRFLPEVAALSVRRTTFLRGYWQSPRYFDSCAEALRHELQPPEPLEAHVRELGREMAASDSVAVGVRLYEEERDPAANARGGRVKTVESQAGALHRLLASVRSPRIFVFCTHRSPALDRLQLPAGAVLVTEDLGFRGALENLWLLSRCRHHVFNNSSFYWWGAWLSEGRHRLGAGTVLASDNFVNPDCLERGWQPF